ncbi:MAG: (Fe-S)-binding protein [Acidimicrobiia bacterium]|nr:(Fe-S)-binding protein [Acidimicrobiia bacterium]
MGWTTPWAPTRAELAACVECGLCLPVCPTFRLTGDETASPRGRINAMRGVASGLLPLDASVAEVFEFCLQCRACEAACPSLVPFGRAMEGARAEATAALAAARVRRGVAGRWVARRRAVGVATWFAALGQRLGAGRWLPGPLGTGLRGMRRLRFRPRSSLGTTHEAVGMPIGTAALLAGCVMDPWFGEVHRAVIAVLTSAGYRVVVPAGQTCCGALAAHEGRAADADRMAETNRAAFAPFDLVVVDAAGCSAHLVGHGPGPTVEDAVVVVARLIDEGRLPTLPGHGTPVAVQDPCHHRHAQRITAPPRTIVRAAGYVAIDLDPDGMCCGAAGLYSQAHPDTSDQLGRAKADQVAGLGVDVVASANPGCEMQLRARVKTGVRVAHPVELYAEALLAFRRGSTAATPT